MVKVKLTNRIRTPLSTIKLAQNDENEMNPEQVSNLYNFTNPLTGKPFGIRDMDELFYQSSVFFDESLPFHKRNAIAEQLCGAMGYSPSAENMLTIRDHASKYISHNYFNSREYVTMLRKTTLPAMDLREQL